MGRKVEVFFDVACAQSYLACLRVKDLAEAIGQGAVELEWTPVLREELFELPAIKGKSSELYNEAKKRLAERDLEREAKRWGAELHTKHATFSYQSTAAQTLLCGIQNSCTRGKAALELLRVCWAEGRNINDIKTLQDTLEPLGILSKETEALVADKRNADKLQANTKRLYEKGGFGVPTLLCTSNQGKERIFFGQDRTFFAANFLGIPSSHPLARPRQLFRVSATSQIPDGTVKMVMFHDFSSPWSFLGFTQASRVAESQGALLEYKPVLLGALFKSIGTPNVPMFAVSEARREYGASDMGDWLETYGNINLQFPKAFPIRTVLPLRISIIEPKTVPLFYHSAWIKGIDIGSEDQVREVLLGAGFDAAQLIGQASSERAREELKKNTDQLARLGGCGVPTFQVKSIGHADSEIIWGQDRLNVVSDMLAERKAISRM